MKIDPYNPLDLEVLGESLLRRLESSAPTPIAKLAKFGGSGIYVLYYRGNAEPYAKLGQFNRKKGGPRIPIYVGRAKGPGARKGVSPLLPVEAPLLWDRIKEHRASLSHASDLDVEDFLVRFLVVLPVWIPLSEAAGHSSLSAALERPPSGVRHSQPRGRS